MSRSLAAAYAVKKMGKKSHRADCPGCDMCHGGMMAEGGDVYKETKEEERLSGGGHDRGVFAPNFAKGVSAAGHAVRTGKPELAKEVHHDRMNELKKMRGKDRKYLAEGGEVHEDDDDMVDRIVMLKRMAEGGVIANDDEPEADAESADFDDLVEDDQLEGEYPGSQEIGDEREDDDRKDVVSRIMRSRSKKDRMPRPA